MPADHPQHGRTQEQSIKARKHQLFEDDEPVRVAPTLPFADLLRTTPAEPLSPTIRGLLWAVGSVVVLLLAAALMTQGRSRKPKTATSLHAAPAPTVARVEVGARASA